jgi:hypothetical protein
VSTRARISVNGCLFHENIQDREQLLRTLEGCGSARGHVLDTAVYAARCDVSSGPELDDKSVRGLQSVHRG